MTSFDGFVAPGFEEVRMEFERNFVERGEIGAAVAAYSRGEKVVDLREFDPHEFVQALYEDAAEAPVS